MIPNLVDSGSFANAAAILINAVYFKGAWATQFKEELTVTKAFHGVSGDRNAQFMQASKLSTRYALSKSLAVVSLPYKDPSYSLVVFMPTGDFGEWRAKLTAESLHATIGSLKTGKINLELPKFKIESTTVGKEALQKCGVSAIFGNGADLSGISDEELFVSAILHKAVFELSEEGTEAAAATQVSFTRKMAVISICDDLIFDRPFLYALIREDTVLFLG
ncbi:hypothetical protein PENTCL1PPCAC_2945, partial [Pristionchus entomophagus]